MHARDLLLELRRDKGLTYKELCRRLEAYDVHMTEQALINKLNRGLYSFGFALLMLPIGLSYDHRVIDGGTAARFTVDLVRAFENFRDVRSSSARRATSAASG